MSPKVYFILCANFVLLGLLSLFPGSLGSYSFKLLLVNASLFYFLYLYAEGGLNMSFLANALAMKPEGQYMMICISYLALVPKSFVLSTILLLTGIIYVGMHVKSWGDIPSVPVFVKNLSQKIFQNANLIFSWITTLELFLLVVSVFSLFSGQSLFRSAMVLMTTWTFFRGRYFSSPVLKTMCYELGGKIEAVLPNFPTIISTVYYAIKRFLLSLLTPKQTQQQYVPPQNNQN